MAGAEGFEPSPAEPNSAALPLRYAPICICRRPESNRQCRQTYVESNHSSNYLTMPFSYFCICNKAHQKKRLFLRQLRLPITPFAPCGQSRNRTYNSLLESLLYVPLCNVRPQPLNGGRKSRLIPQHHLRPQTPIDEVFVEAF